MTLRVLLVEDSASDVRHTLRAFRGYDVEFEVATDGETALRIAGEGRHDIILLDLNLPRVRGDEVLRRLKSQPETRLAPVVILTSSSNPDDVRRAYGIQAAAYMQKPATPAKLRLLASSFSSWWALAELP